MSKSKSRLLCRLVDNRSLDDFLKIKKLTLSTVTGDGFCLFRAVEGGLKQQQVPGISLKEIISKVQSEFVDNKSYYSDFCLANRNVDNDLRRYLEYGKFDQDIADVSVAALCNGLGVRLLIYDVCKTGTLTETVHPPGRVTPKFTVQLLRSGSEGRVSSEHYDLLLPSLPTSTDQFQSSTAKQRKAMPVTIPDMFWNHKKKKVSASDSEESAAATATADAHSADSASLFEDETQGINNLPIGPNHQLDNDNTTNHTTRPTCQPGDDEIDETIDMSCNSDEDESILGDLDDMEEIDQISSDAHSTQFPSLWTSTQAADFTRKYPWLFFSNGCLGCTTCKNLSCLGSYKTQGTKLSKEWCKGSVTFNCDSRKDQLSSLRKKMRLHQAGKCHKAAVEIMKKAGEGLLESVVVEQRKHLYDSTFRVFRTVYSCLKNNRPFTELPVLVELQKINGLDMGLILHSDSTAGDIADVIGCEMRKRLCLEIISAEAKIAIIMDESTTISSKSVLILYLRAAVCQKVTSFFLDLIELESGKSEDIMKALKIRLSLHGFTHEYLAQHLIAVCSDGASVMVGTKTGVLTELSRLYPRIVRWHCLCHRIELSVADTLDEVGGVNHFTSFLDKVYSVYSPSPKNQRELAACAQDLDIELQKVSKMLTIRWVASTFRSVSAVHRNYAALHAHFTAASKDMLRDDATRKTFRGLALTLRSEEFILNLGLMMDTLSELATVSKSLQMDDITLTRAYTVINRAVRAFQNMIDAPASHVVESVNGVQCRNYRDVCIDINSDGVRASSARKQAAINRNQFLQSIANNMQSRLYTTIASNVSTSSKAQTTKQNSSDFTELISQIQVLDRNTWPLDITSPWIDGELKLKVLCDRFALDYKNAQGGFRDLIDSEEGKYIPELQPVTTTITTIPVTSADAERGFSSMNLICTPIRNRLGVPRLSNLIFISLVGPPLKDFSPLPYVRKWLVNHRSADDNQSKKVTETDTTSLRYGHMTSVFH